MKPITTLTRLIQLLSFIFLLLAVPISHAQLIDADAFEVGDNKAFTLDFARYKLIWMDASELLNLDRNEVQQLLDDGLAAKGWRFPTLSEAERIFTFMYTSRVTYDPNRQFPFVCLASCINVFADTEGGQVWPTFQETIGFEASNGERFSHTYYTSARGYDYFPFDIVLNAFEPGQESPFPQYPELSYDDFYYHSFIADHPGILRNYYDDMEKPTSYNPFSFLLVKDVPTPRNSDDTPIPEPASLVLMAMAVLGLKRQFNR